MMRLVLSSGSKVRQVPLVAGEMTLGSADDNDIVLKAAGVSRHHLRLDLEADGLHLFDLDSRNGLYLEGKRQTQVTLRPGGRVQVGSVFVAVEEISTDDARLAIEVGLRTPLDSVEEGSSPGTQDAAELVATGPAAALRLMADEGARSQRDQETRGALLDRCRTVIGARSLLVLANPGRRPCVIAACSGPLPQAMVLDALAVVEHRAGQDESRWVALPDGSALAVAPSVDRVPGVVALFARGSNVSPAWHSELLRWLAGLLDQQNAVDKEALYSPDAEDDLLRFSDGVLLGSSEPMKELLSTIRQTLSSGLDVLLTGETGTGKELFAHMIHLSGRHSEGPFIPVNCPGIPTELQEAEFFGIEKGVASGVDHRPGYFTLADGGTLFLDEIGDMPAVLQAKLLRVLQEREFYPVGATKPRRVDVRVVACTNRDLRVAVAQQRFRPDLYFRLRQLQYHLPPLRQRREDIPELALEFTRRFARLQGKEIRGISQRALALLLAHDWPGNIRELKTIIENAVALCRSGEAIETRHLARYLHKSPESSPTSHVDPSESFPVSPSSSDASATQSESCPQPSSPFPSSPQGSLSLEDVERAAIREALRRTDGNRTEAAKLLRISRAGLYKKMQRLGIDKL